MKKLVLAVVVLAAGCAAPASLKLTQTPLPASATVVITQVSDGDTYHAEYQGENVDIRLLGADTPEIHNPKVLDAQGHEVKQCGGPEAARYAFTTLKDQSVTVTADPTQANQDRYGRYLRVVTAPDGTDFSVDVTGMGLARAYVFAGKPAQNYPRVAAAQKWAQTQGFGIWGALCGHDK